jgi:beta-glucanase (GH16 family)
MKKILYFLLIFSFFTQLSAGDWKLIWSDEFNYNGLPDSTKWDYEVGFERNFEMQYYTCKRAENARVENGYMIIEGRKEQYKNPRYKQNSGNWQENREYAQYTSASVITLNKMQFKYGRIEIRAKLPQGKGVWPAIWALGVNRFEVGWPLCGEIDIMEFVGHDPHKIYATVHYGIGKEGKHKSKGANIETNAPYDDFHLYALEWDENKMDFFFDQTKYFTFYIDDAGKEAAGQFRKPFYLLINLALGGSWGREIDDSIFPQQYLIDYVRFYKKNNSQK